jgi:transposase InsO family protein
MGRVASNVDNTMMESFSSSMQRELLDQKSWASREELGQAIFDWIKGWYNPRRRHSGIGDVSPIEFERNNSVAAIAA